MFNEYRTSAMRALGFGETEAQRRARLHTERNARQKAEHERVFDEWCAANNLTRDQGRQVFAHRLVAPARHAADVSAKAKVALERNAQLVDLTSGRELALLAADDHIRRMGNILDVSVLERRTLSAAEQAEFDSAHAAWLRSIGEAETCESAMLKAGLKVPPRTIGPLPTSTPSLARAAGVQIIDEPQPRGAENIDGREIPFDELPERARAALARVGGREIRAMKTIRRNGRNWLVEAQ